MLTLISFMYFRLQCTSEAMTAFHLHLLADRETECHKSTTTCLIFPGSPNFSWSPRLEKVCLLKGKGWWAERGDRKATQDRSGVYLDAKFTTEHSGLLSTQGVMTWSLWSHLLHVSFLALQQNFFPTSVTKLLKSAFPNPLQYSGKKSKEGDLND
jgi:hypothetical protein